MGAEGEQESEKSDGPSATLTEYLHENSDLLSLFGIISGASALFPQFLTESNNIEQAGITGSLLILLVVSGVLLHNIAKPLGETMLEGYWIHFITRVVLVIGICGVTVAITASLTQYLPFLLPLFDKFGFVVILVMFFMSRDSRYHIYNIIEYNGETVWAKLASNANIFAMVVSLPIVIYEFEYFAFNIPFVDQGLSATIAMGILLVLFFTFTLLFYVLFVMFDMIAVIIREHQESK